MRNNLAPAGLEAPQPAETGMLLGERLVAGGILTEQQVRQALEVQSRSNSFFGQILVDLGFVSASTIGALLAQSYGVRYVDLLGVQPDPAAVALVPEGVMRDAQVIPLRIDGDRIEVAMVDPLDVAVIDKIHLLSGRRVMPLLTMSAELQRTINDLFDAGARTSEVLSELETETTEADRARLTRAEVASASEAPIVRLVDSIIENAVGLRASDIHFEPQEAGLRVRYRIDGTLLDQTSIPRAQMAAVIARLKVLCVMDITEARRPQDGRMRYDNHGRLFDIRVSSVPTVFGEKLVLRVLDKASVLVPLAKLGFLPWAQQQFETLIQQPHGMVLVVGPTGSGKSTTLYSSLNLLNDSKRNIMTLEDPVEYNVPGLNQIQVNPRVGLTFASGLRAFVRQDPDVILVGEIRDHETAEMAVQAALTGHLLLSTLHTNSAVGTMARLANLGIDKFLIAQALSGVVSQRLVARVCVHCAADYRPEPEVLQAVRIGPEEERDIRFRRGRGCRACHGRGYLGRMGLYEVLVVDQAIKRLIMRSATEEELEEAASRQGMQTLRESAMVAVRAGITTPEEMGRVVLAKEN
ncbi:MAG TPA: GspE/PulE family protein [Chthonomonadaceae bacterium]|nr:GspE/PulE family protein [Chthonomonadaceae bacterium]